MRWRVMAAVVFAVGTLAVRPEPGSAQPPQRPLHERVEVARILIDTRVFDERGRPVTDLEPADFEVKIGGRGARVESAEWIGAPPAAAPGRVPASESAPQTTPSTSLGAGPSTLLGAGRMIVFLVQKSLQPLRITGLMRVARLIDGLLASLTPDDRVAVVSFDSRLRSWTDFTTDVERVRAILTHDVITRLPAAVTAARDVSLLAAPNHPSDTKIFSIEHALRRIGEALEPHPGAKSVVVLGYGFGRFNARTGGVILMDGYEEASAALQRARVAVFTLNVTQADFNSLQAGLQTVSAETGGLYASTYLFPARAIERLAHGLAGHYVLFVERPVLDPGAHRIDVRLTRRKGTVIARTTYVEPD